MAKVVASRFALLRVEDDEDDVSSGKGAKAVGKSNPNQQSQSAKKRNKKKKKAETQAENAELKNMAFGKSGPHRHPTQTDQGHGNTCNSGKAPEKQWEEWRQADEQFAVDAYERDLQEALMMSKLEFEEDKKVKKTVKDSGITLDVPSEAKEGKKKKQKDKPMTMSLEQFNQMNNEKPKVFADELEEVPSLSLSKSNATQGEGDSKFFDHVDDDVHKIIQKEKIQEEYQKQYAIKSVISASFQEQLDKKDRDIDKKDKEIEFLRATMKKVEEEYKQVKKRNKQLCVILAQGEMKDKAEVLMQVEQLIQVKDELTEQVTELTAELEKERSKVHSLKAELDKQKGTKHGGK